VRLLLTRGGDETKKLVTEWVVKRAARNKEYGHEIMELFYQYVGIKATIRVIEEATACGQE